jgi:hypothetical protein
MIYALDHLTIYLERSAHKTVRMSYTNVQYFYAQNFSHKFIICLLGSLASKEKVIKEKKMLTIYLFQFLQVSSVNEVNIPVKTTFFPVLFLQINLSTEADAVCHFFLPAFGVQLSRSSPE